MASKIELRENLNIEISESVTAEELFQNTVLRPIIKLQNDIFLTNFFHYLKNTKINWESFSSEKRNIFIDNSFQKDNMLKNIYIGMTIGMMDVEELQIYYTQNKMFNKRIINMITERLKSQIVE
ncbi:glyoxalase [Chryseobacterium echinoideorum]|uniref:glyoxalase n=1 Tax=Chryseobacterium echinoideorum TaxID=1549648 RepID=UPI001186501D|nr:glyoxalase [Chryseobacterium echinoideorum]